MEPYPRTIAEAAAAIRAGELTATELGAASLERATAENERLGAYVTLCPETAMAAPEQADADFAVVRRMALSLLKNEKSQKVGVKTKRLTTGWNDDYLEQVLFGT